MKMPILVRRSVSATLSSLVAIGFGLTLAGATPPTNPVIYVNQVPVTATQNTVVAIAGSHLATTTSAPRGGGLMIYYPDGTTRNLTAAAGFGEASQFQGSNSIAVRDPQVHWDANRAIFSMVIGAPENAADDSVYYWQIYEVTGLGRNDTPVITRVAGQPTEFNNIQPTYSSGGDIFFVSDRTLDGSRVTYPARNETGDESVTGVWGLDRSDGTVTLIDHSPSGSFKPFVDSFGRVVFSRWDHLQRDTVANTSAAVDFTSEDESATTTAWTDIFPEPVDPAGATTGHSFDLFLPWTVNQDGTGLLTMNHLGRHELGTSFTASRTDSNLTDVNPPVNPAAPLGAQTRAGSYLQIAECPLNPGKYVATDAVSTAVSAGRYVTFTARPETNADDVTVTVVNNTGIVRDPSFLSDGRLMGSFTEGPQITSSYGGVSQGPIGPAFIPAQNNPFTIRVSTTPTDLTTGCTPFSLAQTSVTYYADGQLQQFNGQMWQLQPVEVITRAVPATSTETLQPQEIEMFQEAGVSVTAMRNWLRENEMALVVSRDVTSRDDADRQQPFSLGVRGGAATFVGRPENQYFITDIEFFQGDYVRGYTATGPNERKGRRVTPRRMHGAASVDPDASVLGSTRIDPADGSMAMIVPASRALTWQLTDNGEPVVRERYWVNFAAGEIRLCANCHGNNTTDQSGELEPDNSPEALRNLLVEWSAAHPEAGADVSPYEFWAEMNISYGAPGSGDGDGDGLTNMEEYGYGTDPNAVEIPGGEAQRLRSQLTEISGADHVQVSFTRRASADGLVVAVEASQDLSNWSEVANIVGGEVATDGSVSVSISATDGQEAAGLEGIAVTDNTPITGTRSRYFRLRFSSE